MKKCRLYGSMIWEFMGFSVLAGIVIYLVNGISIGDWQGPQFEACSMFIMAGGMMIAVILFYNLYQSYVPMALSLNARRKEVFLGIQAVKFFSALGITAEAAVPFGLGIWLGGDTGFHGGGWLALAAFCALFITASVGNLIGSMYYRFGKLALAIMMILAMICGGIIGALSVMGGEVNLMEFFGEIWSMKTIALCCTGIALIAGILDILGSWAALRKMEIRC